MKKYRIAIYLRLSKEDDKGKEESSSISMQRILLKEYAEKNFADYELMEFCDDGYTGTNFERPGMQEMLERIRSGGIDCVIVKDFSRFARDYIELGAYLEQIFPFLGVRFISVNDNYDSSDHQGSTADMDVNFKSLLYDLYSRDLSVKVRSALSVRKEKGQYVSANSPFGYEKDPKDRHSLMIAEDEAAVVRKIFALAAEGYTSAAIARSFNETKVRTPIEFKIEKGKTSRAPKGERFLWSNSTICQILRNEIYIGNVVQKKYTKDFVGGRNHLNPREEWLVTCGRHAPIIDKAVFDKVQEGRGKKRSPQCHQTHPLVGKLVCGCCGKNLQFRRRLNSYFTCTSRYSNAMGNCVRKVNALYAEQYILLMLQDKLGTDGKQEQLPMGTMVRLANEIGEVKEKKRHLEIRIKKLKEQDFRAYQDYVYGRAEAFQTDGSAAGLETGSAVRSGVGLETRSEAGSAARSESGLSAKSEVRSAEEELACLCDRLQEMEAAYSGMRSGRNMGCTEDQSAVLSKEMIDHYIDKIVILDEQHIEIRWKEKESV